MTGIMKWDDPNQWYNGDRLFLYFLVGKTALTRSEIWDETFHCETMMLEQQNEMGYNWDVMGYYKLAQLRIMGILNSEI